MTDLSYLSTLTDSEFDKAREEIVSKFISTAPPEHQPRLMAIQQYVDDLRASSVDRDAFWLDLQTAMVNSMSQISTYWQQAKVHAINIQVAASKEMRK